MRCSHTRLLAAALLVLVLATSSFAEISSTAVLFLRIAPGARAAAMGEAFVAMADDATATHYNPAGLGAYPLSENWIEMRIPNEYQPIRGLAALKTRGGDNYLAYDIWALTPKGLMRYDNKHWYAGEVFATKTDETVERITSRYFGITEGEQLDAAMHKVAAANNRGSLESLQAFRDTVLKVLPKDYPGAANLQAGLDSLVALWPECRVNWDHVGEAQAHFSDGMKDGELSARDAEKILFAVEHARNRFIPEEITLPYTAKMQGEPTVIASDDKDLLIGTTSGLVRYNGRSWQTFTTESGLPSDTITSIKLVGNVVYVGTVSGLTRFNGLTVEPSDSTANIPKGKVTALGGSSGSDVYAVIGDDLYHFNGSAWSNTMPYTAVIEDSIDKIAAKFALYGTAEEHEQFMAKLVAANPTLTQAPPAASDSGATMELVSSQAATPLQIQPGMTLQIPYVTAIKGTVTSIATGMGKTVWLGTSYGVAYLDKDGWDMPGYKAITADSSATLDDIIAMRKDMSGTDTAAYRAALMEVNGLTSGDIAAGSKVLVYKNPAAAPVEAIEQYNDKMIVATDAGMLEYNGKEWTRSDLRGLGHESSRELSLIKDEFWAASDRKIVMRAKGRPEISTMYVKWLPELASDLYFTFLSFVKPTESWGTFGGNVSFVSYGSIPRTDEDGNSLGTFDAFDVAVTGSYGTSLSNRLKGGVSAKFLYSHLSPQGAGAEVGSGTATGFAVDLGLLYHMNPRMNLGLALTNLGPKLAYIDANQADDLPRNLSLGFAYKVINSDYNRLTFTGEANKLMVNLDGMYREVRTDPADPTKKDTVDVHGGLKRELKESILNTGIEYTYANLISARGGYVYDWEGQVKFFTVGLGISAMKFKFDVAYIPSGQSIALSNIMRWSLSFLP